jgi:CshA-type fibril repeat protein
MNQIKYIILFLLVSNTLAFGQADIEIKLEKKSGISKTKSSKVYTKSTNTKVLGNYVWFDYNQNGLQDYGEQGLSNVTLNLYDNSNCTGSSIQSTSTNAIGTYIFGGLSNTSVKHCIEVVYPNGWTSTNGFIKNITVENNLDLDIGLYHTSTNCQTTQLNEGDEGTYDNSVGWSKPYTLDVKFKGLVAHGYCHEYSNSGPRNTEKYTVHMNDRLNFSTTQKNYLSRIFSYMSDSEVIQLINEASEDENSDIWFNVISRTFVWYYTDWNRDFTKVENYIASMTSLSSTEKIEFKKISRLILNKVEGIDGETQYPAVKVYYLWNETNSGHQDLIVPETSLVPNLGECTVLEKPAPSIDIETSTNGIDADTPTGPSIDFAGAVTWTYLITNNGNVALNNVRIDDSKAGSICTVGVLGVGESKTCTKVTTAVEGQYSNIGVVVAMFNGEEIKDTDATHYLGGVRPVPLVDIEVATNNIDADAPTGPSIGFDETVTWTYVVRNTGNIVLKDVVVTDNKLNQICSVATLAVGASKTCTKTGKATEGQYANVGTVNAKSPQNVAVTDTDPSHYIGSIKSEAKVDIEVSTNGSDADTPTGPAIKVEGEVEWKYVVENTGNVTLKNVKVTDDKLGDICTIATLAKNESKTCKKIGTAIEGQYRNIGTVRGEYEKTTVSDSDKSHYLGEKKPEEPKNPPVTQNDAKVGERCKAISLNILDNDSDVDNDLNISTVNLLLLPGWDGQDSDNDGDIDTIIVPDEGKWTVSNVGLLTYTPSNNCRSNPTNLAYRVSDETGKVSNNSNVVLTYAEAQKVSLGNFVWFDADQNGKQDKGEVGLEDITVELYDVNGELNATTKTDENGTYSFVNLDAGEYSLKFTLKEGYSFSPKDVDDVNETLDSDVDIQTTKTDSIILTEGQNNVDIDAGMFITPKPSIEIVKTTNGGNVNNILVGDVITWTYVIKNTGNTVVSNIVISDDKEGAVTDCDGGDSLNPMQSRTCTKVGTAIFGTYSNIGHVEGLDLEGNKVSSEDESSYVGKDAPALLGTVGDYVWLDSNKNGLQDNNELALKDVVVQLFDKNKKLISSTQTDATGKYLFKDILAGEYYAQFTVPNGYTVTVKEAGSDKEKDSNVNSNGKSGNFTLAAGANDLSIDLGLYPTLTNLGDKVFLDKNANGIQDAEDNQGVANVNVKLYSEDNTLVAETKTTSTGQYLFRNLVPANYYVVFDIPNNYTVSPQNQGTNESDDSDANPSGKTEVVTLVGGQDNKAVDMGLYQEAIKLGDRVWYDTNKNGIQDSGETGVGDVKVTLYSTSNSEAIATTKTSASGIYLFDKLLAGEYYIIFTKPTGYTITKKAQGAKETDSDPDSSGRTANFTLVAGTQDSSIDMGVYQAVVSYGDRVFLDTNHNGLQDLGEKGVRDVNVTIYSANSDFSKSMLTDENGNYLFTHLPAGEYSAEFRDIPYGHLITERDVNNNESDLNDSDGFLENKKIITEVALLTPGKNDLSWDLGIYKTVCLPGKSVLGNLVFEDFNKDGIQDIGEPGVAAVSVTLFNNDTDAEVGTTATDENGHYEFAHVDPAFNYYVQFTVPTGFVVSPQDQDDDSIDSDADATGKTDVIVVESDQINSTVDMGIYRQGSTLGDRVFFDELNGVSNGIQDAGEVGANDIKVTLYAVDGTELKTTRTNASGEYHFTNILAGRYTLGFSELPTRYVFSLANQGNDDEKDSDVNANGRTDVIVVNGQVNITSIDAGLKKLNKATSASDIKSGISGQNVTLDILANDTDGTFSFDTSTVKITSIPDGAILSKDGRTLTVPNEGVWSVNPDTGAITFTPADGFVGDPTPIAYTVEDTEGNETGADVEINYPPLAVDDNVNAQTGTQVIVYVLENDSNTSSPLDITSLRLIDPASGDEVETVNVLGQGTWNINIDGSVTFTPDAGFVNNPTPIKYVVREVAGDVSNRATITIVYPDAVDDVVIIPRGTSGEVTVNVIQNDRISTATSTLTIGCEEIGVKTLVVSNEGTWSVNDDGTISFVPQDGFISEPTDIQYTFALASGERSNCATIDIRQELLVIDDTVTLNVGGVTLVNILSNDLGSLNAQSIKLLLPLVPVEGTTLSPDAQTLTVPGEGVWHVNDLGIVSFTAEDGFTSEPTPIRYTIENNNGLLSNVATITLSAGGLSVVANDDTGVADAGTPIIINVLENDIGDLNHSSVRIITPEGEEVTNLVVEGEGTWSVNDNGTITFTGEPGFVGTPTPIKYIVHNNSVIILSDEATVTITGTCDCTAYETSIPAMGKIAALIMIILTLLIMISFKEE